MVQELPRRNVSEKYGKESSLCVEIDYAKYAPDIPEDQLEAYYGLPKHVQFCNECVMSNHRAELPVMNLNIRSSPLRHGHSGRRHPRDARHACYNKANGHIDWALREKELRSYAMNTANDGSHDCLVRPGKRDSFFMPLTS